MRAQLHRAKGFTLIELIIATIVIGIMAAAISPLVVSSLRAYDEVLADVVVLDKLRYATERIAREVREVNYDPTTGFAFTSRGANAMSFTRTYVNTSGVESANTLVTIGNTGAAVTLAYSLPSGVGAQVLTDELGGTGNLAFAYYQADGATPATSNTDVRYVQISLTLVHNGNNYPQRTRVELKRYAGS